MEWSSEQYAGQKSSVWYRFKDFSITARPNQWGSLVKLAINYGDQQMMQYCGVRRYTAELGKVGASHLHSSGPEDQLTDCLEKLKEIRANREPKVTESD